MRVVYSNRAYLEILAETYSHPHTETGGILLGRYEEGTFYILEVVDPGYGAVHRSPSFFEYDEQYATHVANTRSRLYSEGLHLLGLWHRHPGSFDQFSATDQDTHRRYLAQRPEGIVSVLVNLDPGFRLTTYFVLPPARLHRLKEQDVVVGDSHIPPRLHALKQPADFASRGARPTAASRQPSPHAQPAPTPARKRQSLLATVAGVIDSIIGSAEESQPEPPPDRRDQLALDMLEAEMEDYLEGQRDYTYTVQLEHGAVALDFEYIGQIPHYPERFQCLLSAREGNPVVYFDGKPAQYRRGAIRRYVESSIARRMEHFDHARPPRTAEGLTENECVAILGLNERFSTDDLKRAYRERLREYHPDNWVRENDPFLVEAANRETQRVTAAYRFLAQRYGVQ